MFIQQCQGNCNDFLGDTSSSYTPVTTDKELVIPRNFVQHQYRRPKSIQHHSQRNDYLGDYASPDIPDSKGSVRHRNNKVPPSPEQHDVPLQQEREANISNNNTTEEVVDAVALDNTPPTPPPRAWDRIEQIKRHHDEEIAKIRGMIISPKQLRYENMASSGPKARCENMMFYRSST